MRYEWIACVAVLAAGCAGEVETGWYESHVEQDAGGDADEGVDTGNAEELWWAHCRHPNDDFGSCEFAACMAICDHYYDHGCSIPDCFDDCKGAFLGSDCRAELRELNACFGQYTKEHSQACGDLPDLCEPAHEAHIACAGPDSDWWFKMP